MKVLVFGQNIETLVDIDDIGLDVNGMITIYAVKKPSMRDKVPFPYRLLGQPYRRRLQSATVGKLMHHKHQDKIIWNSKAKGMYIRKVCLIPQSRKYPWYSCF